MGNALRAARAFRNRTYRILKSYVWWNPKVETMDAKAKKRREVIKKKIEQLRPRLAGAKQQSDDPHEVLDLQKEISALEAEALSLKDA